MIDSGQLDLQDRILVAGRATGPALVLTEPLSFWGGFNPHNGEIIDIHHPQYQQKVSEHILFIPASRGSAGTPGGIAETLRNGTGPAGIVLGHTDLNIAIGAMVANRLYGLTIPVVEISLDQMQGFTTGDAVAIGPGGLARVPH